MSLLAGVRVADIGAGVGCIDPDLSIPLAAYLNHGKAIVSRDTAAARTTLSVANLIVCEGRPDDLRRRHHDAEALRRVNPSAALVYISPFGQTGPKANDPASDLTLFFASGIARLLTGQVDDLAEAPIRPVGEQSAFIGGPACPRLCRHARSVGRETRHRDRRLDSGGALYPGDDRAGARRAHGKNPNAKASDGRQWGDGDDLACTRWVRGHLA